ncbi:MAG: hypothetical protein MZV70_28930 [Desulfobacterales bacterium]|nr:hypothetical protein [Desulfobacterales bacterium]
MGKRLHSRLRRPRSTTPRSTPAATRTRPSTRRSCRRRWPALTTYSSTPYRPVDGCRPANISTNRRREWDPILNAEAGIKFQDASCQPKFLIEVSDGMGNVPSMSDTGLYGDSLQHLLQEPCGEQSERPRRRRRFRHRCRLRDYPEAEEEQIFTPAPKWPTPAARPPPSDSLYAMHQEDAAPARGCPTWPTNKDELMDVFRTIMNNVKGAVFFGSAPAATTSTDLGDMVVLASFNAGNWTGEIEAIAKEQPPASGTPSLWKASENIPATRNVWTVDAGNNLTAYTASTLRGDNYLCKKIGDIVHSTPMVVGTPPFFYAFDNYASFKRNLSVTNPRREDGLRGVQRRPAARLQPRGPASEKLGLPAQEPAGEVERGRPTGPPTTRARPPTATATCWTARRRWPTCTGVRRGEQVAHDAGGGPAGGGTAYTALDVTSGESFGAGADPAKFLWELTDADLGESWSDAAIERVSLPGRRHGRCGLGGLLELRLSRKRQPAVQQRGVTSTASRPPAATVCGATGPTQSKRSS